MPYFLYLHVCMCVSLYLCIFLSEIKADRLANDSDVQMDAVGDGLATCI